MENLSPPLDLLTHKIGVYSTVLSYYGFYVDWKLLYLKTSKKTKKFWDNNKQQFVALHSFLEFDALLLRQLDVYEKRWAGINDKENVLKIHLDFREERIRRMVDLLLELNMPEFKSVSLILDEQTFNDMTPKFYDLINHLISGNTEIFGIFGFKQDIEFVWN